MTVIGGLLQSAENGQYICIPSPATYSDIMKLQGDHVSCVYQRTLTCEAIATSQQLALSVYKRKLNVSFGNCVWD